MPSLQLMLSPRIFWTWRATPTGHPVAAAWMLIAGWIDRSLQRKALADLDDHMLRDIGIARYDAARECRKPFWK